MRAHVVMPLVNERSNVYCVLSYLWLTSPIFSGPVPAAAAPLPGLV